MHKAMSAQSGKTAEMSKWARRSLKLTMAAAFLLWHVPVLATTPNPSTEAEGVAETVMNSFKENWETQPRARRWSYEQGVFLKGLEGLWMNTADGRYFRFIQETMDHFVKDDGTIETYRLNEYNIDNINNGTVLLLLYQVTGQDKYRKAAALLREQLKTHPRTSEGGFWHKQIYPSQMWLDGLYMGEPFYAEYASLFHEDEAFDDIARQFVLMETHSRDSKTGLLYHGWDESRKQRWADPATGRSPNFWGRAMGWYAMALVDTLDYFPQNHPRRKTLIEILGRLAAAVQKYQDPKSGLWYQVVDKATGRGNYLEASASCMFTYALAKGVRKGYLPASYLAVAQKADQGILKQFVKADGSGRMNLEGTVSVAGLGGNPYRDGSYEYYLSEKVVANDLKGVGAYLMASNEIQIAKEQTFGRGRTVTLDDFFNHEMKKDAAGRMTAWHYKWDEMPNSGFFFWGKVFRDLGVKTETLSEAPTAANLPRTNVYIIVDPDTKTETENPNFIEPEHVKAIADWVKKGGVLVLMGNDAGNAEFDHFNQLAKEFGIRFNQNSKNRVPGNDFSMGSVKVSANDPIFQTAKQLYLKEISTLSIIPPAKSLMQHNGDVIMAGAQLGKGYVFAVGDPWFYNEYVDGRKLPPEFDNFKAAQDLSRWLIQQTFAKRK